MFFLRFKMGNPAHIHKLSKFFSFTIFTCMVAWKQLALSQTCAVVQWQKFIFGDSFLINNLPISESLQLQNTAFMQVLRDPAKRQGYNQTLKDNESLDEVSISERLDSSEMSETVLDGIECLEHNCRCGGSYIIARTDLLSQPLTLVVPCTNCSLVIEVHS